MKVLILGCTGMLGNAITRYLIDKKNIDLIGTYKDKSKFKLLKYKIKDKYYSKFIYQKNLKKNLIINLIKKTKPDYVLNCIGMIKQVKTSKKMMFSLNASFPKMLENLSNEFNFNLIHLSTDCVFSGKKGFYTEKSKVDAVDMYGKSKIMGELSGNKSLTIRTSIIGNELISSNGLLEWFLNSKKNVNGFTNCYFSGFPTIVLSKIIYKNFLRKKKLPINGIIHLSSLKISKYDLLKKIKKIYNLKVKIYKNNYLKIDRSLNSIKFKSKFKFKSDSWNLMIKEMKKFS